MVGRSLPRAGVCCKSTTLPQADIVHTSEHEPTVHCTALAGPVHRRGDLHREHTHPAPRGWSTLRYVPVMCGSCAYFLVEYGSDPWSLRPQLKGPNAPDLPELVAASTSDPLPLLLTTSAKRHFPSVAMARVPAWGFCLVLRHGRDQTNYVSPHLRVSAPVQPQGPSTYIVYSQPVTSYIAMANIPDLQTLAGPRSSRYRTSLNDTAVTERTLRVHPKGGGGGRNSTYKMTVELSLRFPSHSIHSNHTLHIYILHIYNPYTLPNNKFHDVRHFPQVLHRQCQGEAQPRLFQVDRR